MATPETPSLKRRLLEILYDLVGDDFERFKFFLMDKSVLKEFQLIPREKVNNKERPQILQVMMDTYCVYSFTITQRVLKEMGHNRLLQEMYEWNFDPDAVIGACQDELKSKLESKFQFLIERMTESGEERPFNERYTELYVTMEDRRKDNEEHEIRQMERDSRKPVGERNIECLDIFKGKTKRGESIRTVLTKGVAGIGKTVLTQKFSMDWAEGRANQNIDLLFPFTFRELNNLRGTQYSLVGLLHKFFSESAELCSFQHLQVVFIFDGLDECRLPLDFTQTQVLTEATESVSVEVLLVNLIRGSLLPSARLWITTRPAAANQIPAECVSMVTEVQGFTDPQKEQYFRKRFRDEEQATAVISHIKTSRSLYIMCQIPVFCWIIAAVIQHMMKDTELQGLPQTLTNLYIHFIVFQLKQKNVKYNGKSEETTAWSSENKMMIKSLGKLAFDQLQKGNLIFYESDLSQCGLELTEVSMYSGVFTQVFREESGLYQDKVYCFIHLSVQEFLAALHVHQSFISKYSLIYYDLSKGAFYRSTVDQDVDQDFYQSAVDQALKSSNGHLDLFLRFLLGLSLPTNQNLLRGLLTQTGSERTNQKTVDYIKEKLNKGLSAERSINLFHCLNELNYSSLVWHIQCLMRNGNLSDRDMSQAEWSALTFILLSSDTDLDEFDLKKYCASDEALVNLLPVFKDSTKAILSCCNLSQSSCGPLSSILSSSSLTLLDLSHNDLQDSGVKLLCSGLKTASCRLETLRLSGCLVTEEGGASLVSALSSAHSHLRELDLSYNHLGPSAELLTTLWTDPHCPLDTLRLEPAGEQWMTSGLKKYSCQLSLDPNITNKRLHLSENNRRVTWLREEQYPDHQDRSRDRAQVLCSTGLTGCCYWEVDWGGKINIAVSYRGIRQGEDGGDCWFGDDDQSWSLRIIGRDYSVCHNKINKPIFYSGAARSGRVAVFLDSEAGYLSFYQVRSGGKLFHLYTFTATFTKPLFAGFGLESNYAVSLVTLGTQHYHYVD